MAKYSDFMPAGALAPNGSPWTFWHYPPHIGRKQDKPPAAEMLCGNGANTCDRKYTLYGVPGCRYVGVQDGLPYFTVLGHGVQGLTLEQALACNIARMAESEAGNGGVKRADPR